MAVMGHMSGELRIARPVADVFDAAVDEPSWNPAMTAVDWLTPPPFGVGTRFRAVMGGRLDTLVEITEYERPRVLGSRTISPMMSTDGAVTFTPDADGTVMRWDWRYRLNGPWRVLSPVFATVGGRWEESNWTRMKELLEAPTSTGDAPAGMGWASCSAPGARVYDATFGRLLGGFYDAVAADLALAAGGAQPEHIVDVGTGPGRLAVALALALPQARVTGVDIDPAMVALAAERITRAGLGGRIAVIVGDVRELPLEDASVDLVTSTFSVHHWPEAALGFAEVHRVLRPGGRLIVYDLPDRWGRFETHAPRLRDGAHGGGFRGVRSSRLRWPGPARVIQRIEAVR